MSKQIATRGWVNDNILPGTFLNDLTKAVLYGEVSGNTGMTVAATNSVSKLAYVANQAVLEDDFNIIAEFDVTCDVSFLESSPGTILESAFTFTMRNTLLKNISITQAYRQTDSPSATPTATTVTMTCHTGGTIDNPTLSLTYLANESTSNTIFYNVTIEAEDIRHMNQYSKTLSFEQDDDLAVFYFTRNNIPQPQSNPTSRLSENGGHISNIGLNYGKKRDISVEGFDRTTFNIVTSGTLNVCEGIDRAEFDLHPYGQNSYVSFDFLPNYTSSEKIVKLVISASTLAGRTVFCNAEESMNANDYAIWKQASGTPQFSITRIDGGGNISSTGGTAEFRFDTNYVYHVYNVDVTPSGGTSITMHEGDTGVTVTFPQNTGNSNKTYTISATAQTITEPYEDISATITVMQNAAPYITLSSPSVTVHSTGTTASTNFTTNCTQVVTATSVNVSTATVTQQSLSATFPVNSGSTDINRSVTVSGTSNGVSTSATFNITHSAAEPTDFSFIYTGGELPYSSGSTSSFSFAFTGTSLTSITVPAGCSYSTAMTQGILTLTFTYPENDGYDTINYTITAVAVDNYGNTFTRTVTIYQDISDISVPLTFEILGDGYINWSSTYSNGTYVTRTIEYNKNNGGWISITSLPSHESPYSARIDVVAGDVVKFRGNNTEYCDPASPQYHQVCFGGTSCPYKVKGNIMSMISPTSFRSMKEFPSGTNYNLQGLFQVSNVVDASELLLPATALTNCCYGGAGYPNMGMFSNCTSLTAAPKLPATTLSERCYGSMFYNCTSLTSAPELPATTLADYCYWGMFNGCTSITSAPELPATTLADYCYESMFHGCTSLTSAPELPATTLAEYCYYNMLSNCRSINYIKCLATNISATNCTNYWVNGVAASGTFVKNPSMTRWTTGTSGIPSNWTVQDAQ